MKRITRGSALIFVRTIGLAIAAIALGGCAAPSRAPITREQKSAAREAGLWIGAVQDGDHEGALAAERRLESLVGLGEAGPWELEAAAARWAEVALEIESGRELHYAGHPTLARALKRHDNLTNALRRLQNRLSDREFREGCARTLDELAAERSEQVREIDKLRQTRTEDAPAVVCAKWRLRAMDTVIDRLRLLPAHAPEGRAGDTLKVRFLDHHEEVAEVVSWDGKGITLKLEKVGPVYHPWSWFEPDTADDLRHRYLGDSKEAEAVLTLPGVRVKTKQGKIFEGILAPDAPTDELWIKNREGRVALKLADVETREDARFKLIEVYTEAEICGFLLDRLPREAEDREKIAVERGSERYEYLVHEGSVVRIDRGTGAVWRLTLTADAAERRASLAELEAMKANVGRKIEALVSQGKTARTDEEKERQAALDEAANRLRELETEIRKARHASVGDEYRWVRATEGFPR